MLNAASYPEFKFPKGFLWGSATAGHQIEGDNVHSSNWRDEIARKYAEPSGKACDHWRLYREDIDMIKALGHNAYRLSLNWARLEPENGRYDEAALSQYIDMLTRLKERGIKTFVTISHGGDPAWFGDLGGFSKRENIAFFERHVRRLVPKIKDLVDFWLVINEFNIAGGDSVAAGPCRANCLVAHARGYHIIKEFSKAPVSSAHALRHSHPANPFDRFRTAVRRAGRLALQRVLLPRHTHGRDRLPLPRWRKRPGAQGSPRLLGRQLLLPPHRLRPPQGDRRRLVQRDPREDDRQGLLSGGVLPGGPLRRASAPQGPARLHNRERQSARTTTAGAYFKTGPGVSRRRHDAMRQGQASTCADTSTGR
jgi:hypothetical protein